MKLQFLRKALLAACLLGVGVSVSAAHAEQAAEGFPPFYDLRLAVPSDKESGYDPAKARVNPIRNQGVYGTCWAFSAIASIESNVYLQMERAGLPYNVEENTVNLSEWYLAWVSVAPPIGVTEDPIRHSKEVDNSSFYRPFAEKVYAGGVPAFEVETMMANGTGLDWERNTGVRNLAAPSEYRAPVLGIRNIFTRFERKPKVDTVKEMLVNYGAVSFALNAEALSKDPFETAFFHSKSDKANHAVNIVGWDDSFDFSRTGLTPLPKHKGAWIIRNSWGKGWADHGYAYLSYEDKSFIVPTVFDMDADVGSVSYVDRHEANNELSTGEFLNYLSPEVPQGSAFAAGFTGEANAFLRRVGFYALQDNMDYTVEVRLGDENDPTGGRLVCRESGRFGEDGSPAWSGYRIIPLKQAVFLPEGEPYIVTVELSAPQGDTQYLLASSDVDESSVITSFVRLGKNGAWQKVLQPEERKLPPLFRQGSVVERCYLKKTDEPVGCEFLVASLDDRGRTPSAVIDLGRHGELYGKDLLNPGRETLTRMRLVLEDANDFSGSITGEGDVVKEGSGTLTLRGKNTCTGQTTIADGTLLLAPPAQGGAALLSGDVLLRGGTFGGRGEVKGSIRGTGTLELDAAEALRVDGTVDLAGLHIKVAGSSAEGQVLLRAEQGLLGVPDASSPVHISADRRELIAGR